MPPTGITLCGEAATIQDVNGKNFVVGCHRIPHPLDEHGHVAEFDDGLNIVRVVFFPKAEGEGGDGG